MDIVFIAILSILLSIIVYLFIRYTNNILGEIYNMGYKDGFNERYTSKTPDQNNQNNKNPDSIENKYLKNPKKEESLDFSTDFIIKEKTDKTTDQVIEENPNQAEELEEVKKQLDETKQQTETTETTPKNLNKLLFTY